ncbi:Uncharacterized conserved protein YjbJ, UPF0337 family [Roseivivax marinus]|uniref:CsbD family protein n=1 Tax=Roseivivax marinus TaxID=1379903 RepID=UPI0008C3A5BA|nr:CsbD family protein [Roseivivax marinus]SEL77474.1 Uncharacterized conserved protein YjbJ, UPF0337 family [Roseivivax marinus]
MNWDQVEGNWKRFTGSIREQWGDLTDNDVQEVKGNREQLEGKIQAKYGKTKEEASHEVDKWLANQKDDQHTDPNDPHTRSA